MLSLVHTFIQFKEVRIKICCLCIINCIVAFYLFICISFLLTVYSRFSSLFLSMVSCDDEIEDVIRWFLYGLSCSLKKIINVIGTWKIILMFKFLFLQTLQGLGDKVAYHYSFNIQTVDCICTYFFN